MPKRAGSGKAPPFVQSLVGILIDERVTDREYRVYNAVLSYAWEIGGGICSASAKSIGKRAGGKGERQTREILDSLVAKGVLCELPDTARATRRVYRVSTAFSPPLAQPDPADFRSSTRRKSAASTRRKSAAKVDEPESDERSESTLGTEIASAGRPAMNPDPDGGTSPRRRSIPHHRVPDDGAAEPIDPIELARAQRVHPNDPAAALDRARWLWAAESVGKLGQSPETATIGHADRVAARIAVAMGDVANIRWYRHLCRRALSGILPAPMLSSGILQLMMRVNDPAIPVKHPGAYFAGMLGTLVDNWNSTPSGVARPASLAG